jgi:hypothetical protein
MAELHQMTGDPELAFDNQTLAQSIEKASAKIESLLNCWPIQTVH